MRESVEPNIIFQPRKKNKFGAIKTVVDNIRFDSKSEAAYYIQLKLLKYGRKIKDFELQPKFEIAPAYISPTTGRKVAAKYYVADFKVYLNDGSVEIVDCKSEATKTPVYMLKKHLFEARYHQSIKEVYNEPAKRPSTRKRTSDAKAKVDQRKLRQAKHLPRADEIDRKRIDRL